MLLPLFVWLEATSDVLLPHSHHGSLSDSDGEPHGAPRVEEVNQVGLRDAFLIARTRSSAVLVSF